MFDRFDFYRSSTGEARRDNINSEQKIRRQRRNQEGDPSFR